MILTRVSSISFLACAALACGASFAADPSGDYATDLGRVYGTYQVILAVKEACEGAHADRAKPNQAAYAEWQKRHQALIEELERHYTALVRGASTDAKDYARNVGKYEGALLASRQENQRQFLAQDPKHVAQECRDFPAYLKSEDADLRKRHAEELKTIRKRK
ncbi:MAG: hypothetical protein FJY54_09315 [Betaproteobacteria bacterium]|nr:hypothetical protein [Betaproteobacteria bacterium]